MKVGQRSLLKVGIFFSLFTGITLDILLKSLNAVLPPPYCDWLQRFGQTVLLFSVFYRYVGECINDKLRKQYSYLFRLFPLMGKSHSKDQ